jgi:acetyl/propionyl-CoA carboxylase alpha subunit
MKTVRAQADLLPAIEQSRREAISSFGDGTLYIERLIERPRHVEFQIIADDHGNVVHLFERECSIQRRHQKIVEESPSVALTPGLRKRMGEAAVALARAAEYRNAGTMEFLVEGTGDNASFYFLETNTRLQVEHPVTEQVCGVDLVRAQILLAAGEKLPWTQPALTQRGHAIEVRVYAEDSSRNDLPQAGPLLLYREPVMPGVRVDAGVAEGGEVSVHYDPMIAKLIATAETRELARRRAIEALRHFPILGIRTNIAFLIELLEHPRFAKGDIDTQFLESEGDGLRSRAGGAVSAKAAAVAGAARRERDTHAREPQSIAIDPWTTLRHG